MTSMKQEKSEILNGSGFRACGKAAILRVVELDERLVSGKILVPEEVRSSSAASDTEGVVVALGPDCWPGATPRCQVGDRVLFTRFTGGLRTGRDGKLYRFIPSDAIYAVMEG